MSKPNLNKMPLPSIAPPPVPTIVLRAMPDGQVVLTGENVEGFHNYQLLAIINRGAGALIDAAFNAEAQASGVVPRVIHAVGKVN